MNQTISKSKEIDSKKVDVLKQNRAKSFLSNYFSFIGLAVVLIIFQVATEGRLISSDNLMNIFNNFFSIGLSAMGVVFLVSLGELDLSVGATMGFAAALAALATAASGITAFIFPVTLLVGMGIGLANGLLIAKLKVSSFIGTLAMSFIARGLTTFLLNGTVGIPGSMRMFDNNVLKIATFVGILILFMIIFNYTGFGKRVRAIGSSTEAARQSGVKVDKVKVLTFVISGVMCGLIAFFSLVRTSTASSSTGEAFEFDVILAILFGGMPLSGGWPVKFRSAVLGSLTMAARKSGMSLMGVGGLTQQLVQGVLLIIIASISFDRRNAPVIK